jgi:protease-4
VTENGVYDSMINGTIEFSLENEFLIQPRRNLSSTLETVAETNELSNTSTSENMLTYIENRLKQPRKFKYPSLLPAKLYYRKMKKGYKILEGFKIKETKSGNRIAIINAVGGINTGKSSNNGLSGKSLGSDTLIELVRRVKADKQIKAVVIRVDSPGGSALASDLMWREIRQLSAIKPVVASMVDVAASGGYYISMACDQIVAEELTVTGSIGVVTSKFNAEELNKKIGLNIETISRGRFAEVKSITSSNNLSII